MAREEENTNKRSLKERTQRTQLLKPARSLRLAPAGARRSPAHRAGNPRALPISITLDTYSHLILGRGRSRTNERGIPDPEKSREGKGEGQTDEKVVSLNFTSWNRTVSWLRQLEAIRAVA